MEHVSEEALWKIFAAFSVAIGLVILTMLIIQIGFGQYGDVNLYRSYGHALQAGQLPYHNFQIEYPPGVLPILLLASWFGSLLSSFTSGFLLLSLLVVTALLYHRYRQNGRFGLLEMAILLLPVLQFAFFELDVFAAVALYASVWQFQQKQFKLSAALLAIATLIKAYPGVCLIGLIWLVPKTKRKMYLKTFAVILVAVMLPLAILVPKGLWFSLTYHTGRPIEFEATAAAIGYVGHLFGWPAAIIRNHKSFSLSFPGETIWANIASTVLAIVLLSISWLARQGGRWRKQPAVLSLTLIIAFILLFKVASPQYMVVPLILLPLAKRELNKQRYSWLAVRLFIISTLIWLEFVYYFRFLRAFNDGGYRVVFVVFALSRALLLTELLLFLLRAGRSKTRPAKAVHP
jgi:hypothetical protein